MTPRLVLTALRRRWYVVLAVFLVAGVASVGLAPRHVYWTRAEIVFLPPDGPGHAGNALEGTDESLIFFAASVERTVNGGPKVVAMSSDTATLYGAGTYEGYSVELVNDGGQWQTNFDRPILSVQVVDSTASRVRNTLQSIVGRVETTALQRQQEFGVSSANAIRTQLNPEQPQVASVGGSAKRALVGEFVLAAGLAMAAAILVDNRMTRRAGKS